MAVSKRDFFFFFKRKKNEEVCSAAILFLWCLLLTQHCELLCRSVSVKGTQAFGHKITTVLLQIGRFRLGDIIRIHHCSSEHLAKKKGLLRQERGS